MKIPLEEIIMGFGPDTWNLLQCIEQHPGLSHRDLRLQLNFSQPRIEKELSRLEGALLIKTDRNPEDKRLTIYKITEYGKEGLKINSQSSLNQN